MVNRNQRGLALLLIVSLMALMTLLVVSLAVITRVETRIGTAHSYEKEARRNARLALAIALGRLQEAAGPDQRITATAEGTGTVDHPQWVGVWRADGAGASPETWLVSGSGRDPSSDSAVPRRQVRLVRAGDDPAAQVVVPLEFIEEVNGGETVDGAFAYFIADQGVKAQLSSAVAVPTADDLVGQNRFLTGGSRPVGFGDDPGLDGTTAEFQAGLRWAVQPEQWKIPAGGNGDTSVAGRWHDYAGWSRGLLVDPAHGVLKTDLSLAADTVLPGLQAWSDLATPERAETLNPTYPMRPNRGGDALFYDGIHPIITQLGLQFDVQIATTVSLQLEARMKFFVELSNLYSSALDWSDMRIRIFGIPSSLEIETESIGTDTDQGTASVDLESYFAENMGADGQRYLEFDLPPSDEYWPSGRSINWKLPSGDTMGGTPDRSLEAGSVRRDGTWTIRLSERLSGPDRLQSNTSLYFTTAESWHLRAELFLVNEGGQAQLIGSYSFPEFHATDSAAIPASGTGAADGDFGIHVRMLDREDLPFGPGAPSPWLTDAVTRDFRRDEFTEEDFLPAIDLESASYHVNFPQTNSAPERRQVFGYGPLPDFFSNYQPGYNRDVALFELPRQPWLSVGALQHLAFSTGSVYNLGNSWSEYNDWFDRFLFSGITQNGAMADALMNPMLEQVGVADVLDDATTAERWWVRGAFNVNSVRPAAWAAVLRGLGPGGGQDLIMAHVTHDQDTSEVNGAATMALTYPMARFSQSAGETWEISPNADNLEAAISRTYRRGVRSLSEPQIIGLADRLAAGISTRIASVGPYRSIQEFLAPDPVRFEGLNVIEYAISSFDADGDVAIEDRINWDHYFSDAPEPIDVAAPSYLTSADLMTALASMVNVRSDTFVIRTYGEVIRPTAVVDFDGSEPLARAWLEAVVQRFPEGVDPADFVGDDWSTMIENPKWGRRFRVISMRWLAEDDL